ncbi:MAG: hypothetical protein SFV81_15365 [Pirellulaceae bacterium]|nr:hypothetical protein [Pirellulaceae bacterium]
MVVEGALIGIDAVGSSCFETENRRTKAEAIVPLRGLRVVGLVFGTRASSPARAQLPFLRLGWGAGSAGEDARGPNRSKIVTAED